VVLYPFKVLATWLHELSHGIAMIITGSGFDRMVIYRDTSGLAYAYTAVGSFGTAIIAAAGYMGTPLWGAVLLVVTPNARAARNALIVLAVLLVGTTILVIAPAPNGDRFGQYIVPAIGAAIALAAILLPDRWRVLVAHFIAAQACVNALLDIRVLLRPSQVVDGKSTGNMSDAHNMAASTFGTTETWAVWTWAIIWLAWSLVILFVALRVSGSRAKKSEAQTARATESLPDENDRDARRHSPVTAPGETDPNAPAGTAAP
jgi:preprotein translocase subunit SecG